jgi:hypothetical protein
MSFFGVSGLDRLSLTRFLLTALLPVAFMIMSDSARAQQGVNGMNGADCFTESCMGGNGIAGEPVTANGDSVAAFGGDGGSGGKSFGEDGFGGNGGNGGNGGAANASGTTNATAVGGAGGNAGDFFTTGDAGVAGNGGDADAHSGGNATSAATANGGVGGQGIFEAIFFDGAGNGGNGTATSSATAIGSGNATSSATATGGDAFGSFGFNGQAGGATAASSATAKGSGSASASATATPGVNVINHVSVDSMATSYAETAKGGLAQAQARVQAQAQADVNVGLSQSTAKTTFGGVSVQSTVELIGGGSTEAIAQGGSGQSPVNPGQSAFVFSSALPNIAYATALIGSANNVTDALLGPDDVIFGTANLEGGGSSTFDFSFRGDLILGNISDNSVINLGFIGPNINWTIEGDGVFVLGGAVPEPSTWAMMLIGFAGLGLLGYRSTGGARGSSRTFSDQKAVY